MCDLGLRIIQESPASLLQAIAQISILEVKVEVFIEKADGFQGLSPGEKTGPAKLGHVTAVLSVTVNVHEIPRSRKPFENAIQFCKPQNDGG
jgi:hypothetical protein